MNDAPSAHRQRGWLLAQQGRLDMAERELRLALVEEPDDPDTHALLALVLADMETRDADALREAKTAVGLAPDDPFAHYAEAQVHLAADRWDPALRAASTAVRLDPDDPRNHALLAAVHAGRRRWPESLAAADEALALDPEHSGAANLRASALVHLGRKDEADATLHGTLARDPENSHTHANQGWALLHRGDREGALRHFREALRLEPENDWAREGLAETIKARNPLYAGMLRYFLWMNRLSPRTRWMVIIGGYVGHRIARGAAIANPELEPWLVPLMVAYGAFVLLSWTAPRIFDAVLLASREGRYVLSPQQRSSGRWMAAGLAAALGMVAAAVFGPGWATMGALAFAGLLIPLAATFRGPRGAATRPMAIVTGGLYAVAVAAVASAAAGANDVAFLLFGAVLLAVAISTWVINLKG